MTQSSLQTIFKKTEKGMQALKVRDHALSFKLRNLLIMVDGNKSVEQLSRVTTSGADALEHMNLLLEQELVQIVSTPVNLVASNSAQTAPASAAEPTAEAATAPTLQSAIKRATKALIDVLGPHAENLCVQIEKCKSIDEYNEKILALRKVVAGMRNETIANDFVKNAIL